MKRWRLLDTALGLVTVLGFLVLYAPLFAVVLFSLFPLVRRRGALSLGDFTTESYAALAANTDILSAIGVTLAIGAAATLLSVALGAVFAFYFVRTAGWARQVMQALIFLPFLLPPVITGLALLIFFRDVDLGRGYATTIIGHVVFILPIVYRTILVRLRSVPRSIVEASLDLGASGFRTFVEVVLPQIKGALILGGILAFAVSFDETLITLFVSGSVTTLPIRLWAMMRVGLVPEINALATLVLLLAAIATVAIALLERRANRA